MTKWFKNILLISLTTLGLHGCLKDFDPPGWTVDALLPAMKTDLTLKEMIRDTLIKVGEGDSLFIIFREELVPLDIDTLLTMDVKSFIRNIKLDSIRLNNQQIIDTVTMEALLVQAGMDTSIVKDGSFLPVPAITGIPIGPFLVDGSEYFQEITLNEGVLEITVDNGFPIDVENVEYAVVNNISVDTVTAGVFPLIAANTVVTDSVDLSGKKVEGLLDVSLVLDVPGTGFGFVPINYEDAIVTTIKLRDLKIYSAMAIFPAQNIIEHREVVYLEDMEDMEVTSASFKGGSLRIRVVSTVEEETYFTYNLPNATRDGVPFSENITCPPAPPGGSINQEFIYSFDGYDFDLTGQYGDTVNAFYNEVIGRIDSTGQQVFLTLEDSVDLIVEVLEMDPVVARGYMGQDTFTEGPGVVVFDAFDDFGIDSLGVAGAELSLTIENSLGMEGLLDIQSLEARNTLTNKSVSLEKQGLNLPVFIGGAQDGDPPVPAISKLVLNDQNSNPSQIISLLPNSFGYALSVQTNPGGNDGSYSNFAYADHTLKTYMDVKIPMTVKSGGIRLSDTVPMFKEPLKNDESIKGGNLLFLVDNGFPVKASVEVVFLDSLDAVIHTFKPGLAVEAASLDEQTGMVSEPRLTELIFELNEELLPELLGSKKAIVTATFETKPEGKYVHLFNHYSITINAVADFKYEMDDVGL